MFLFKYEDNISITISGGHVFVSGVEEIKIVDDLSVTGDRVLFKDDIAIFNGATVRMGNGIENP